MHHAEARSFVTLREREPQHVIRQAAAQRSQALLQAHRDVHRMMRIDRFTSRVRHTRFRILLATSSRSRSTPLMPIERELIDLEPFATTSTHALLLRERYNSQYEQDLLSLMR
jgi:hypothetical protein